MIDFWNAPLFIENNTIPKSGYEPLITRNWCASKLYFYFWNVEQKI